MGGGGGRVWVLATHGEGEINGMASDGNDSEKWLSDADSGVPGLSAKWLG